MKILHVEAGMHLYGGALQVVFLQRGLAAEGVENLLAAPTGSAIAEASAAHARVVTMAMGGDADLGMLGRLRRLIRSERPDVVHLHSRRGSDLWGGLAGRLEGVPVVLSRRVDNPEPRAWVGLKYRLYDRVITISQGIFRVLEAEGVPASKLRCVPSSVDVEMYRPGRGERAWLDAEFGLASDELAVGMAAQFIARKGHRTLLAALPAVLAAQPRTRFLIFGQGPLREAIENEARAAGFGDRVLFPGFRKDLARVLPALDLMVHPAEMEGLGVALLQAAACGLPIVAGRAGGIPEIVLPGVNGELIEPGDHAALAQHLVALLADAGLRARYGATGREHVVSRFSVAAMVRGNLAVYRELVPSR
ncbi:glycosyltransferase [Rubrivivax gelatinosus]|uniref:Glycosyl transferase n=1 Tax=Rubrivivax gelatinosus TaxID=28068 RepID=A0ABS1DXT3_RUBGE|nr:glycosyltransferase [Rubrivivax gelatinosus]MBK1713941.1 glycosyl transferase [Rubrivivax gelatinosus]